MKEDRKEQNRCAFEHRLFEGDEFAENDAHGNVQKIDGKGEILAEDLVVKTAIYRAKRGEEAQEKERRKNSRKVHFHHHNPAFCNLQEKEKHAQSKEEHPFAASDRFTPEMLCRKIAQSKVGKPEKEGVSGVADGHIGILQKMHIAAKEQINGNTGGHGKAVQWKKGIGFSRKMNANHEKCQKKP